MTTARQGHPWGHGNPEEASHPIGLEGEALREGFLVEAAYEMNVEGCVGVCGQRTGRCRITVNRSPQWPVTEGSWEG